jgi:hypothetical protein
LHVRVLEELSLEELSIDGGFDGLPCVWNWVVVSGGVAASLCEPVATGATAVKIASYIPGFGLVWATLAGIDLDTLLTRARGDQELVSRSLGATRSWLDP